MSMRGITTPLPYYSLFVVVICRVAEWSDAIILFVVGRWWTDFRVVLCCSPLLHKQNII